MNILLTGGMGFIGSHTAIKLLATGFNVVIYDNLSNADPSVIDRIETITKIRPTFIQGDIRDAKLLEQALNGIDTVIHFAGLKAVGESVHKPIEYPKISDFGAVDDEGKRSISLWHRQTPGIPGVDFYLERLYNILQP